LQRGNPMRIRYRMSSLLPALTLMTLPVGFGCQSSGLNSKGGSGGASHSGGTSPSGGASSGGVAGSGGLAGSGGSTVSTGGSTSMCYVDFPCQSPYLCTSTGYQPVATNDDCHSKCGPGPCSGATCDAVGSEIACPAGTRCVSGASDARQACQPIDAGMADTGDSGAKDTGEADLAVKTPLDAPACDAGASTCQGQNILTCDSTGVWKTAKACPYACSNGACAGDCTPGAYQCQDSSIQRCSTSGLWETVAT